MSSSFVTADYILHSFTQIINDRKIKVNKRNNQLHRTSINFAAAAKEDERDSQTVSPSVPPSDSIPVPENETRTKIRYGHNFPISFTLFFFSIFLSRLTYSNIKAVSYLVHFCFAMYRIQQYKNRSFHKFLLNPFDMLFNPFFFKFCSLYTLVAYDKKFKDIMKVI